MVDINKRFKKNMEIINKAKIDYSYIDEKTLKIKVSHGEMLFYPYTNYHRLMGKSIYGGAERMIENLKINNMIN